MSVDDGTKVRPNGGSVKHEFHIRGLGVRGQTDWKVLMALKEGSDARHRFVVQLGRNELPVNLLLRGAVLKDFVFGKVAAAEKIANDLVIALPKHPLLDVSGGYPLFFQIHLPRHGMGGV